MTHAATVRYGKHGKQRRARLDGELGRSGGEAKLRRKERRFHDIFRLLSNGDRYDAVRRQSAA